MGSFFWDVKMTPALIFMIILSTSSLVLGMCPHPNFLQNHVCDYCNDWKQVLEYQVSIGAKGITSVMGPPVHTFPPLFRQNGPYSNDLCLNRQARPAYRCNMDSKRPYCFKVANRCFSGHFPENGIVLKAWDRMALIHCVDDYTWNGQHTYDDYSDTNRRDDTRYD